MHQQELVERAGRGDHDAFALIVHGSIVRMEAVARLVLRDPELARDAVQDAYIRRTRTPATSSPSIRSQGLGARSPLDSMRTAIRDGRPTGAASRSFAAPIPRRS